MDVDRISGLSEAQRREADKIIAGLSEAQKRAVLDCGVTPYGNHFLLCHGATSSALRRRLLSTGNGDWQTLTETGLAVRSRLLREG